MSEIPPFYKLGPNGEFNSYKKSKKGEIFYLTLRESFKEGNIIEFNSQENVWPNHFDKYIKTLLNDFQKDYNIHQDLDLFYKQYKTVKKHYDIGLRWSFYYFFVDFLISIREYEKALKEWNILRMEEWGSSSIGTYRDNEVTMLMEFEKHLNRKIVDAQHIFHIAYKGNQLTNFGKKNKKEVFEVLSKDLLTQNNLSFFEPFYRNYGFNNQKKITYTIEYYEKFFIHSKEYLAKFNTFKKNNFKGVKLKNGDATQSFVFLAISSSASKLLRDSENEYRLQIGANKIGEGWISETELYYKIKKHFTNYNIIHHGKPEWLGRQHFDIWMPKMNIAIEYQGAQHDKPIDFFGGEEAFKKNQKRDKLKKQKCLKNDVSLIEVRPGYDFNELVKQIENIIK
jgi:hypothetical protein